MNGLLKFSSLIDRINTRIGQGAAWLMLIAVIISAGNAMIRYSFNISSNAWLEIQWYLFGAMVMLGAAYTLKMNEHVRVDVLYSHYGSKLVRFDNHRTSKKRYLQRAEEFQPTARARLRSARTLMRLPISMITAPAITHQSSASS